jgi:DNA mismatch repair protein MSH6
MDADIGMSEIDLIYMKGSKAHSGFPEVSYGKYASQLVAKGYEIMCIHSLHSVVVALSELMIYLLYK